MRREVRDPVRGENEERTRTELVTCRVYLGLHRDRLRCQGDPDSLYTSGSWQKGVFSWEGRIFCHKVFFRMFVPLALEVYNRLFIDSLGFRLVDNIKKHLLSQIYSIWPSFIFSAFGFGQYEGRGEYI